MHDLRERQINAPLPGTYNPLTRSGGVLPYPGKGYIYLYEDTGLYKQLQVVTSVNTRVNSHISLNGYYAWTDYHTNTNGFPSNQYNTNQDWGRAAMPTNRLNLFGTLGLPYGWTASPILSVSSSTPFNITSGIDYNGDGINNDRPSFAPAGAACGGNIKCTAVRELQYRSRRGRCDNPDQLRKRAGVNGVSICASRAAGAGVRSATQPLLLRAAAVRVAADLRVVAVAKEVAVVAVADAAAGRVDSAAVVDRAVSAEVLVRLVAVATNTRWASPFRRPISSIT